jgi:SAM-dependent methyltransferase
MSNEVSSDKAFGSQYDDDERTASFIARGDHRTLVGAKWDELGQLQLDFLKKEGLRPDHKFLDIGCGCLRAGVKIVPYLDNNNYYGIDRDKGLLDVGHEVELKKAGVKYRLRRSNLYCSRLFKHERLPVNTIDMGICNSVMTHLPQNFIRICLENTEAYFKIGGRLFITIGSSWIPGCCQSPHGCGNTTQAR